MDFYAKAKADLNRGVLVADIVKAMRECGLNPLEVGKAVGKAMDEDGGYSLNAIAKALYAIPHDVDKIEGGFFEKLFGGDTIREDHVEVVVRVLRDELRTDSCLIARILHSPDGLNLDTQNVARILHLPSHPEGGVQSGLGLPADEIARVLHSQDGCNATPVEVARAVEVSCLGLCVEHIAKILHDPRGLGLSANETAKALDAAGIVEEPPTTYKSASQIRAAKNTSKKGIK